MAWRPALVLLVVSTKGVVLMVATVMMMVMVMMVMVMVMMMKVKMMMLMVMRKTWLLPFSQLRCGWARGASRGAGAVRVPAAADGRA